MSIPNDLLQSLEHLSAPQRRRLLTEHLQAQGRKVENLRLARALLYRRVTSNRKRHQPVHSESETL